jgi:hypothetical protein
MKKIFLLNIFSVAVVVALFIVSCVMLRYNKALPATTGLYVWKYYLSI